MIQPRPKCVFKVVWNDGSDSRYPFTEYFFDIQSAFRRGIEVMRLKSVNVDIITIKREEANDDNCNQRTS